jgi:pimeloyl-ACP methyl ester carboxylesterase
VHTDRKLPQQLASLRAELDQDACFTARRGAGADLEVANDGHHEQASLTLVIWQDGLRGHRSRWAGGTRHTGWALTKALLRDLLGTLGSNWSLLSGSYGGPVACSLAARTPAGSWRSWRSH